MRSKIIYKIYLQEEVFYDVVNAFVRVFEIQLQNLILDKFKGCCDKCQ